MLLFRIRKIKRSEFGIWIEELSLIPLKKKTIDPQGKVSLRFIYYFMLMSTCPDKHDISWTMRDICDQNDVNRAGIQTLQERTRYRDILEQFETTVFDNQTEETTSLERGRDAKEGATLDSTGAETSEVEEDEVGADGAMDETVGPPLKDG